VDVDPTIGFGVVAVEALDARDALSPLRRSATTVLKATPEG
jgi:hypothetical protein